MKKILNILVLFTIYSYGQADLVFDKKFVASEDKWVAFTPDSLGIHFFGFIYIDVTAGLTLDYAGSFAIDDDGKFIVKSKENIGFMKYRLQPSNTLVAFIPDHKLDELGVEKYPEWLSIYKTDEDSVPFLYRKGYLYNSWNECEIALSYLEKAEKIDSKYKGLLTELAFSYNALKQFDKAEGVLLKALTHKPNDCYTLKELAYTYQNLNELDKSEQVYQTLKECSQKNFIQEAAYNLAFKYFEKKDKENFLKWNLETRNWGVGNRYTNSLDLMEKSIDE